MQNFDVVIVGGGLVGASLARALHASDLKIALIDQQPLETLYSSVHDNRGLALSHSSKLILEQLDIWSALQEQVYAIQSVHASEQASFGFTTLSAAQVHLPALGYVVSAAALAAAVIQPLITSTKVQVFAPCKIQQVQRQDSRWLVNMETVEFSADLLVAADGTNSQLRSQLNLPVVSKDWQQTALVANVFVQEPQAGVAFERFTKYGVLALLPFGGQRMKCILTANDKQAAELKALPDQDFLQLLQGLIGYRVGKLLRIEQRISYPLQHVAAQELTREAAVIIGNTANTTHPVAAQGFNLGLRDAIQLAQLLIKARTGGQKIFDSSVLAQYSSARAADHQRTQKFTNSLVEIFAADTIGIKFARRFALAALQFIPQLQTKIIQQGLGTCKLLS